MNISLLVKQKVVVSFQFHCHLKKRLGAANIFGKPILNYLGYETGCGQFKIMYIGAVQDSN